jgi:probable phosphoglycerate mutase
VGGGEGGALLLFGFHDHEMEPLAELVGALAEDMGLGAMAVARVAGNALALSAETLLGEGGAAAATVAAASLALPPATRCVLMRGEGARALMPDLRFEMYDAGFSPSVFGTFTPAHAGKPLAHVAAAVVRAHERYWDLAGDPAERARPGDGNREGGARDAGAGDGVVGDAVGEPPLTWAVSTGWAGEEGWKAADVTVAMSVGVDRATVPDPPASESNEDVDDPTNAHGRTREDVSNIVALDGVVGNTLRAALLDAVTHADWPHATADAPPTPKWERETNDGISSGGGGGGGGGDTASDQRQLDAGASGMQQLKVAPNSWGLGEEALEEVGRSAPVRTFLARLGALYPEVGARSSPIPNTLPPPALVG